MITIEYGGNRGTFIDRIFTVGTNILQSTIIKMRARSLIEKHAHRMGPRANEDFSRQLELLGISSDSLWWGPMTLFPRKAQFLLSEIEKQPPKRLLEIGSGTSTSLFAALAVKHEFTMLSLENYKETIKYVQLALNKIPCENRVKLQLCGFIRGRYETGERYRWYDARLNANDGLFDFVFIDGPMSRIVGRNGALPEIKPFLAKKHWIYIDDYNRKHEKDCVAEWKRHYPDLIVETPYECPGIARLQLLGSGNSSEN
jgi:predicted O-methyltransferase YrrM